MADSFAIQVTGGRELSRTLEAMPEQAKKRWVRTALRNGGKVVLAAAQKNAPVRHEEMTYSFIDGSGGYVSRRGRKHPPGQLKRSLAVSTHYYRRSGEFVAKVGPRAGWDRSHVARFLEYGFWLKLRNPVTGQATGERMWIPPTFWLSGSLEETAQEALDKFTASMNRSIKRFVNKRRREQAKKGAA